MDNLEASLCSRPRQVPGSHRIRHDGPLSRIRYNQDLVRAWIIIVIFAASGAVAVAQFFWGHW
jgi:hypothetical protein